MIFFTKSESIKIKNISHGNSGIEIVNEIDNYLNKL